MSSFNRVPPSRSQVTFLNALRKVSLLTNDQSSQEIPTPIVLAFCHFFHTGQQTIEKFIKIFIQEGWLKKTRKGYIVNQSAPMFSNLGEDVCLPVKSITKVIDAFKAGEQDLERLFVIISSADDEPARKNQPEKTKKETSLPTTSQPI